MVFQLPVLTGHAIKGRTLTALVAMIASTGFLLFGYDQGVMSGLINTGVPLLPLAAHEALVSICRSC